MTDTLMLIAASMMTIFGIGIGFAQLVDFHRFVRGGILHTSRFPLFAVRDSLRRLVIDGQLKESNEAWQLVHGLVNRLLHFRNKDDLVRFMQEYLRIVLKIANDTELQRKIKSEDEKVRETAERVPAFGRARDECMRAILYMLTQRTSPWRFRAYVRWLKVKILLAQLQAWKGWRLLKGELRDDVDLWKAAAACNRTPRPDSAVTC